MRKDHRAGMGEQKKPQTGVGLRAAPACFPGQCLESHSEVLAIR